MANVYMCSVEYYNETLPMVNDKYDTDGLEYVVIADSYAEAETMVTKDVGESLIKIWGIENIEAIPLVK